MKIDENYHKIKNIKLLLLDVDGVLTDSKLYLDNNGVEMKAFNSKDGLGLRMLQDSGVAVGVITGRDSNIVHLRAEELGFTYIYQNQQQKLPAFEDLLKKSNLQAQDIAFIGDDVVDLPILNRAGFSVAVADSHFFIKENVDFITRNNGGCGAVREICDLIMQTQGTLQKQIKRFDI
jgi:3-deoxy-D-manno-octulosonate 8-phosphate phosphatase (KDO 8-P phosphatase)